MTLTSKFKNKVTNVLEIIIFNLAPYKVYFTPKSCFFDSFSSDCCFCASLFIVYCEIQQYAKPNDVIRVKITTLE